MMNLWRGHCAISGQQIFNCPLKYVSFGSALDAERNQVVFCSEEQSLELRSRRSANRTLLSLESGANLLRHLNIMAQLFARQAHAQLAVFSDLVSNLANCRVLGEVNSIFIVLRKAAACQICRSHDGGCYIGNVHFGVQLRQVPHGQTRHAIGQKF